MSTEPINYEAVIADLEAKIAQLQSAVAAIRAIASIGGLSPANPQTPPPTPAGSIPSDAFLGMSITDATKKLLTIVRRRLNTPDVIKLLSQGGLPEPAYNTAYAVLRRRQLQVGDIININGEWGLKEWTPNYKVPTKRDEKKDVAKIEDAGEPTVLEVGEEKAAS